MGWLSGIFRRLRKNSTGSDYQGRSRLNLIEGSNVTITVADDKDNDEIDVTIAASASGSEPENPEAGTENDPAFLWYVIPHRISLMASTGTIDVPSGYASMSNSGVTSSYISTGDGLYHTCTATTAIGWATGNNFETGLRGVATFYMRTGSNITSLRYWIGLFNSSGVLSNDSMLTTATPGLAFRYSTNVPDTNWQAVSSDGSAQVVTDTGVAVVADTRFKFSVDFTDPASIKFYINDALVATHTTVPATTDDLAFFMKGLSIGAVSRSIHCRKMALSISGDAY